MNPSPTSLPRLRLTPGGDPLPARRPRPEGLRDVRRGPVPGVGRAADGPRLRLVAGRDESMDVRPTLRQKSAEGEPIREALDPRWVFAVRVSEQLQGAVLPADRRERLVRLGKVLGLTPFDASLVIAIVQDQARRGHAPASCPAAGEAQLRMVPRPADRPASPMRRPLAVAGLLAVLLAAELMLLSWVF